MDFCLKFYIHGSVHRLVSPHYIMNLSRGDIMSYTPCLVRILQVYSGSILQVYRKKRKKGVKEGLKSYHWPCTMLSISFLNELFTNSVRLIL